MPNKATREIKDLAKKYAPAALKELARLSTEAVSEQARVSAINIIFDRAYGKAAPSPEEREDARNLVVNLLRFGAK